MVKKRGRKDRSKALSEEDSEILKEILARSRFELGQINEEIAEETSQSEDQVRP